MPKFDISQVIGLRIEDAITILNAAGIYDTITNKNSSDKVKNSDTLVVVRAIMRGKRAELTLGEFLYNIKG